MQDRPPPAPWRLRLSGDPALLAPDGRVVALERRAAALLALAALEPGFARERAARWLWPDSGDPRRNLRQQLLRFRQACGFDLLAGGERLALAPGLSLEADGDAPLLGERSYDDCEAFATWLDGQRTRRREAARQALRDGLAQAEARGDLDAALALAQDALALEPASEAAHRDLMRIHYLRADVSAGLAVHARLAERLRHEHGVLPSPETQQLAAALRSAEAPRGAAITPATPTIAPTLLRPPRLIGRDAERRAVHEAWAGGRCVLLLGEAGLGKTRLMAELAHGESIVAVQARPGDAGVPYATLARLLRAALAQGATLSDEPRRRELARVLPELAPTVPLPADGQRLVLQNAVEQWLADPSFGGFAVDDLHFADEASVEMLTALVGTEPLRTRRWLFAQRPAEGGAAAAALHDTLLETHGLVPVPLAPLSAAQMEELVDSLGLPGLSGAAIAAELVRHTGGNPMFALETLKQMRLHGDARLPQPASVGALIERRLKQLSAPALALARLAAVAGVDFDIALAEAVLGVSALELADRWAELEAAQVLRGEAFAHDLVHEAALRTLPHAVAARIHAALASHLEGRGAEPARIAAHWLGAGEGRRAVPHLVCAAERATGRFRPAEAAAQYEQAADALLATGERDEAFTMVYRAAACVALLTDTAAMKRVGERLRAVATTDLQRAQAAIALARVADLEGDNAAVERLGLDVVRHAERCGDLAMQAEGQVALCSSRYWTGRLAEALEPGRRARDMWAAMGERRKAAESGNNLAVVLHTLGRIDEARAMMEACAQELEAIESWRDLALNQLGRANLHMDVGQPGQAVTLLLQAQRLLDGIDANAEVSSYIVAVHAQALRRLGRYGESLALLDAFEQRFGADAGPLGGRMSIERGWLLLELGRSHAALQELKRAEQWPGLPDVYRWRALALRMALHAAGAAAGEAPRPDLDAVQDQRVRLPLRREAIALMPAASRAPPLAAAIDEAARLGATGEVLALRVIGVETDLDTGAAERAAADALALRAAFDEAQPVLYLPRAWWALHRALGSVQPEAARDALARGAAWIAAARAAGMPEAFVGSFLDRNPVNRAVLAAARLSPSESGAAAPAGRSRRT